MVFILSCFSVGVCRGCLCMQRIFLRVFVYAQFSCFQLCWCVCECVCESGKKRDQKSVCVCVRACACLHVCDRVLVACTRACVCACVCICVYMWAWVNKKESVLQCVAMCCRELPCIAVCCSEFQRVAVWADAWNLSLENLFAVGVKRIVLHCVAWCIAL